MRRNDGPSESDQDGDGMSSSAGDCNDYPPYLRGMKSKMVWIMIVMNYDENTNRMMMMEMDLLKMGRRTPTSYPGATEISDGIDNDCDGIVDENTDEYDDDGDGFTENGGDCNDNNPNVNPAEQEIVGDSVDNNCDGTIE